jgi:signal transduction histidine kinase
MIGTFPRDYPRFLRLAGLAVWASVGFPVLTSWKALHARGSQPLDYGAWIAAWLLFGLGFLVTTAASRFDRDRPGALLVIAGQAAAAIALAALPPCYGLEGALLVLVAIQLGGRLSRVRGFAWVAAQSAVLYAVMAVHWNAHMGVLLAGAYLPFQLLAFWTASLLARETGARESLARANAELEATRELLVETHRVAERVRIARELHDLLGHHLTALALNLEVASHLVSDNGEARPQIEAARDRAKALLGEVRETVRTMREGEGLRLDAAVRALSAGIPRPRIHVRFAEDLPACDSGAAQVLLRCAQEMITNAVRHSDAENLWLEFLSAEGAIEIQARDDGRGSDDAGVHGGGGTGLSGMRERLEERGGRLAVRTKPGRGFEVVAVLPAAP